MASIAPTLRLCCELRTAIDGGLSMRSAINAYLHLVQDDCSTQVNSLLLRHDQGQAIDIATVGTISDYRRALFQVITWGLNGEPVGKRIRELENEIKLICESEIDRHIATAPLKALLPLMFLQMPSFFIMLFVPLLNEFLRGL